MKHALPIIAALLISLQLSAQVNIFEPMSPQIGFLTPRTYSQEVGQKFNNEAFFMHPDFGKLAFAAPYGKNVVEDISKRTYDSRYYVDLDNPTFFYIEKSSKAINLYKNGLWHAIDPTLHATSPQLYQSGVQACPTTLDLGNKKTSIALGDAVFSFNHYSLKMVHNDGSTTTHQADWSHRAIGNEGTYITNVFPGIDMKIVFAEGSIKSEFIIRENLHVKNLTFLDQLEVPSHLNGYIYTHETVPSGLVIFENIHTGEAEIKFNAARCHDATEGKSSWFIPYTLTQNLLQISCDSSRLNDPTTAYPITVDPLVTVVGPISSPGSLMGSLPSPSFCSNTINVTYPGGTTPWDVSAFWDIFTDYCSNSFFDCYRSEAQVWITSSCGGISPVGAPGTIWTCLGCNSYGTWNPTLPFNNSGTQTLAQCYAPSCSNQTLSFTINSNRTYCSDLVYDNCNWLSNSCNYMNNWSVTVQGRNAETLANTASGNGSSTIAAATCASGTALLNPTAQYGVPGYTYAWSTGASSSTITVPNGPTTYTCQVTDACGTVRTATFIITCPLAINLKSFEVAHSGNDIAVNWTTGSEKENQHFKILRAGNDLIFEEIGQVPSQGDSETPQNYSFMDRNPLNGINYYQLASVDINSQMTLSDIRSIDQKSSSKEISISPNPSTGNFTLSVIIPESGDYSISIASAEGKLISQQITNLTKGPQAIPYSKLNLQKGTYLIRLQTTTGGKFSLEEKLVVE